MERAERQPRKPLGKHWCSKTSNINNRQLKPLSTKFTGGTNCSIKPFETADEELQAFLPNSASLDQENQHTRQGVQKKAYRSRRRSGAREIELLPLSSKRGKNSAGKVIPVLAQTACTADLRCTSPSAQRGVEATSTGMPAGEEKKAGQLVPSIVKQEVRTQLRRWRKLYAPGLPQPPTSFVSVSPNGSDGTRAADDENTPPRYDDPDRWRCKACLAANGPGLSCKSRHQLCWVCGAERPRSSLLHEKNAPTSFWTAESLRSTASPQSMSTPKVHGNCSRQDTEPVARSSLSGSENVREKEHCTMRKDGSACNDQASAKRHGKEDSAAAQCWDFDLGKMPLEQELFVAESSKEMTGRINTKADTCKLKDNMNACNGKAVRLDKRRKSKKVARKRLETLGLRYGTEVEEAPFDGAHSSLRMCPPSSAAALPTDQRADEKRSEKARPKSADRQATGCDGTESIASGNIAFLTFPNDGPGCWQDENGDWWFRPVVCDSIDN